MTCAQLPSPYPRLPVPSAEPDKPLFTPPLSWLALWSSHFCSQRQRKPNATITMADTGWPPVGPLLFHGGSPGDRNFSFASKEKIAQNSIWSLGTAAEPLTITLNSIPVSKCARVSELVNEVGIAEVLKVKYWSGWMEYMCVQRPRSRNPQSVYRNVCEPDGIERSIPVGSGNRLQTLRADGTLSARLGSLNFIL